MLTRTNKTFLLRALCGGVETITVGAATFPGNACIEAQDACGGLSWSHSVNAPPPCAEDSGVPTAQQPPRSSGRSLFHILSA